MPQQKMMYVLDNTAAVLQLKVLSLDLELTDEPLVFTDLYECIKMIRSIGSSVAIGGNPEYREEIIEIDEFLYNIGIDVESDEFDPEISDEAAEIEGQTFEPIESQYVCTVTVLDPANSAPVEVEIRKLSTGAMLGLDGSFLDQMDEDATVTNPYDGDEQVSVSKSEDRVEFDCTGAASN
jgi:hypothetical protein